MKQAPRRSSGRQIHIDASTDAERADGGETSRGGSSRGDAALGWRIEDLNGLFVSSRKRIGWADTRELTTLNLGDVAKEGRRYTSARSSAAPEDRGRFHLYRSDR